MGSSACRLSRRQRRGWKQGERHARGHTRGHTCGHMRPHTRPCAPRPATDLTRWALRSSQNALGLPAQRMSTSASRTHLVSSGSSSCRQQAAGTPEACRQWLSRAAQNPAVPSRTHLQEFRQFLPLFLEKRWPRTLPAAKAGGRLRQIQSQVQPKQKSATREKQTVPALSRCLPAAGEAA